MKVLVAQLCPTLWDPMDCSPPGSSVHGILQVRKLEWIAISFAKRSSWPRDQTHVSCIAGRLFIIWAMSSIYWLPRIKNECEKTGKGDRDGEYMYIHGWFMSMYDKNRYNIVK